MDKLLKEAEKQLMDDFRKAIEYQSERYLEYTRKWREKESGINTLKNNIK